MEEPKLRPIEAQKATVQGKEVIVLRDPSSLSDKVVFVSPDVFLLILMMDGTNKILDLQVAHTRRFGTLITSDKIQELISQLDDALFLESDKFENYVLSLKDEYSKNPVRPAFLWGKAYPADTGDLSSYFYNLFLEIKKEDANKNPRGIISPHIDYARGGKCYAHSYSELRTIQEPTTFIIFGTSHFNSKRLFTLTKKDFETPFGILKNDTDFIEKLEKKLNKNLCEDDFAHRQEHSIELQTVFLKYILPRENIKIVPVLCGSFHKFIEEGITPDKNQEVSEFISAIKELTSHPSPTHPSDGYPASNICFIAGADLSHIGLNFGDAKPVTYTDLDEIKEKDLEMLKFVEKLNPDEFYNYIAEEKDKRRICGLPPIYLLLKTIEANECKLLNYDYWHDAKLGSLVSFVSLRFC